jgi:hypothetical protein
MTAEWYFADGIVYILRQETDLYKFMEIIERIFGIRAGNA